MAEAETAIEAAAIEGSLNFNCNLPFASHSFSLSFSICLSLSIYICLSLCLYPILPLCLFISLCTFHYLSVSLYLYIYIFFSLSISISYSSSFLFVFSSLLINIYHFFPLSSFALPPTISTLSVSLSLNFYVANTQFPTSFLSPSHTQTRYLFTVIASGAIKTESELLLLLLLYLCPTAKARHATR